MHIDNIRIEKVKIDEDTFVARGTLHFDGSAITVETPVCRYAEVDAEHAPPAVWAALLRKFADNLAPRAEA